MQHVNDFTKNITMKYRRKLRGPEQMYRLSLTAALNVGFVIVYF